MLVHMLLLLALQITRKKLHTQNLMKIILKIWRTGLMCGIKSCLPSKTLFFHQVVSQQVNFMFPELYADVLRETLFLCFNQK